MPNLSMGSGVGVTKGARVLSDWGRRKRDTGRDLDVSASSPASCLCVAQGPKLAHTCTLGNAPWEQPHQPRPNEELWLQGPFRWALAIYNPVRADTGKTRDWRGGVSCIPADPWWDSSQSRNCPTCPGGWSLIWTQG